MRATDILREEHRLILKALDILEATADRLAAAETVPPELWAALLNWLSTHADARHHAKEEDVLFPALIRAGVPEHGGPVAVMLDEHDTGRALVVEMAQGDARRRAEQARRYARLLRDHIDKEDQVLFPLADEVFDHAEAERLRRAFERADLEDGDPWSPSASAALHRLATDLAVPVSVS